MVERWRPGWWSSQQRVVGSKGRGWEGAEWESFHQARLAGGGKRRPRFRWEGGEAGR